MNRVQKLATVLVALTVTLFGATLVTAPLALPQAASHVTRLG